MLTPDNFTKENIERLRELTLLEKPIKNDLLLTSGEDLTVRIPDVNSILGDKLTAFAPHTTGIRFGVDKELEIIKQLYDCYTLSREMTNYAEMRKVYKSLAVTELAYRGMDDKVDNVLRDTSVVASALLQRAASIRQNIHILQMESVG